MSRKEYEYFLKIAKEFEASERHGENIVDSAKDIRKVLKKLNKMIPDTDKATGDKRIKKLAQEKALVEKSRPVIKKFGESCYDLNETVEELKYLFHSSEERLTLEPFPRYYGPAEEFER